MSDTAFEQTIQRARLNAALRATLNIAVREVDQQLGVIAELLPNHRLSQIINSLSHGQGQPDERLGNLARELVRLWLRDKDSTEAPIYLFLLRRLGLVADLETAAQERRLEAQGYEQATVGTTSDGKPKVAPHLRARVNALRQEASDLLGIKGAINRENMMPWYKQALDTAKLAEDDPLAVEARLHMAIAVLDTLQTLHRGATIRDELLLKGGDLRWV